MGILSKETIASEYRTRGLAAAFQDAAASKDCVPVHNPSAGSLINDAVGKLEELHRLICKLEDQMLPVLTAEPPQPVGSIGQAIETPADISTPMLDLISSLHQRIDHAQDRINSLIDRNRI